LRGPVGGTLTTIAKNEAIAAISKSQTEPGAKAETVLEAQAPAFSTQEAEAFVQRAFDIQVSAQPLASERDQNFRLRAKDGSEWVLKIANPA
jgi:hydroxylysine kinase